MGSKNGGHIIIFAIRMSYPTWFSSSGEANFGSAADEPMKFVALLSGGKDSCFNISHCQKHGHELVAAASLRPTEGIGQGGSGLIVRS